MQISIAAVAFSNGVLGGKQTPSGRFGFTVSAKDDQI
jgi:hypothetical protein